MTINFEHKTCVTCFDLCDETRVQIKAILKYTLCKISAASLIEEISTNHNLVLEDNHQI